MKMISVRYDRDTKHNNLYGKHTKFHNFTACVNTIIFGLQLVKESGYRH